LIKNSIGLSPSVPEFDIEPYVSRFKKKKYIINNLADIEKLLISSEYQIFINSLFSHFKPKDYFLAGEIIDTFWKTLISKDMLEKFNHNLKKKLKM
jgi:hypothetical protein